MALKYLIFIQTKKTEDAPNMFQTLFLKMYFEFQYVLETCGTQKVQFLKEYLNRNEYIILQYKCFRVVLVFNGTWYFTVPFRWI